MKVVHVVRGRLPAVAYGGIERVVWWLAKEQAARGDAVVLLADPGTTCPFADVRVLDRRVEVRGQVPADADVVHVHFPFGGPVDRPYLVTIHANSRAGDTFDLNAVFISADHARRHGSDVFVHNGIDPEEYGDPRLERQREYFHFLGKAAWRVKNVRGAIRIARTAGVPLRVLGGHRMNVNMGIRLTLDRNVTFAGMVGGEVKNELLSRSRGLLFPVLWHEPFGLAVVESLYFGCPVVGTPFGALPELVPADVGRLSARFHELVEALSEVQALSRARCHEWVMERFTARTMADGYRRLYGRVAAGDVLNQRPPVALPSPACVVV
jgi:glycosyltransferase involved in cell wall biosynthesis